MKDYSDLLRGRIFSSEKKAQEHLSTDDSIFWWESNLIWGYTTCSLIRGAIDSADDLYAKESLIGMCKYLCLNKDSTRADIPHYTNSSKTVYDFIYEKENKKMKKLYFVLTIPKDSYEEIKDNEIVKLFSEEVIPTDSPDVIDIYNYSGNNIDEVENILKQEGLNCDLFISNKGIVKFFRDNEIHEIKTDGTLDWDELNKKGIERIEILAF